MIEEQTYQSALKTLRGALDAVQDDDFIDEVVSSRDEVFKRYGRVFTPQGISELTADEFQEFLSFKHNRHWTGLSRLGSAITKDMDALKRALLELLDEKIPIEDRLDSLMPAGRARVDRLGKAVLTPILTIAYPDLYGVWNGTSYKGMKELGLWPRFSRGDGRGRKYKLINETLRRLRDDLNTDFWTLDALWWSMKGADQTSEPTVWIVRAEKHGEQEQTAINQSVAVIGWNQLNSLSDVSDVSELKEMFREADPDISSNKLANIASQVWQFIHEITDGDLVLLPLKTDPGNVMVGEITGDYQDEVLADNVKHSRPVEWFGKYPRSVFPEELLVYLDVPKTVCRVGVKGAANLITKQLDRAKRRGSESAARQAIENYYPDADLRKPIVEALADTIKYAHGISEKIFSVNLHSRRLSVMVGGPQVMKLAKDEVGVLIDESVISDQVRDTLEKYMDRTNDWKSVSDALDLVIPYEEFGSVYPQVRDAHRAMMQKASKTLSYPHSARAHSPGVLEYLRKELGMEISDPVHPVRSSRKRQQAQGLTDRTFELLAMLDTNPTKETYLEHKAEFKRYLITPFREIVNSAASQLRDEIQDALETEQKVFSRILKNDFGQGGAWPFYWGAFYPKGGDRTKDPQLAIWMNHEIMQIGFFLGVYSHDPRDRFADNVGSHREQLEELLSDSLGSGEFLIRDWKGPNDLPLDGATNQWKEMFDNPSERNNVFRVLSREDIVELDPDELANIIVDTFNQLFPLMILATSPDPMPEIISYLNVGEKLDVEEADNPTYTLLECSEDTGFSVAEFESWVSALERKRQAVFYGPPGTGKTYIAERIAKHLVGGGDGFVSLIQFHPAYAYEDFMQGLRPKKTDSGGFDYELVPGRFFEFCREARSREGRCVMIIDEINRANLSRVFGELMYLLEYRGKEVPLAMGKTFRIPANVRIIGTMNTADRSIAVVDHALRRRFAFIPLYPNYELLQDKLADADIDGAGLSAVLQRLNAKIGDRNYSIGISFFLGEDVDDHIESIWKMEIEPYLEEYFVDKPGVVDEFRWDRVSKEIGSEGE